MLPHLPKLSIFRITSRGLSAARYDQINTQQTKQKKATDCIMPFWQQQEWRKGDWKKGFVNW